MNSIRPDIELEHALHLVWPDGRRVRLDQAALQAVLESLLAYNWLWVSHRPGGEPVTGGMVHLHLDEEGCWTITPAGPPQPAPRSGAGCNGTPDKGGPQE